MAYCIVSRWFCEETSGIGVWESSHNLDYLVNYSRFFNHMKLYVVLILKSITILRCNFFRCHGTIVKSPRGGVC